MITDNNINVYIHKKKTDGTVFYVGQGKGARFKSIKDRSEAWQKIVNSDGFESVILNSNVTRSEALELEKKYISQYGIDNLCNMTIGGLGGDVISFNPNKEEIRRKQIANTPRGDRNCNFGGKLQTEEYLRKQSESNSKVHLRCENTITGEVVTAINSKELGKIIGVNPSNVRISKAKGYLAKKIYKITDLNEF